MSAQAPDLKDSVVAKLVDERHAAWEVDLPLGDDAALWDYLTVLDQGSRLALLAHCLSFGINALHEKVNPYGAGISASGLSTATGCSLIGTWLPASICAMSIADLR
jgi:ParB family chromosome partitioning protein